MHSFNLFFSITCFPIKPTFTPGTYVVTNAKGARSCVGTSRYYPKDDTLDIIKIENIFSENQVRGQIKKSLDWVLIQNIKTGEIFMEQIKSIPKVTENIHNVFKLA